MGDGWLNVACYISSIVFTSVCPPTLSFQLRQMNNVAPDLELAVSRVGGRETIVNEAGTENMDERPANFVAESQAHGAGTLIWHPIALCCECSSGDRMGKLFEARVGAECFGRHSLTGSCQYDLFEKHRRSVTYLGEVAGLEEGCDSHKTILIIPHDSVSLPLWIIWNLECVLIDCRHKGISSTILHGVMSIPTIKSISSCLAKEPLLLARVWYVLCGVRDEVSLVESRGVDVESAVLAEELLLLCW